MDGFPQVYRFSDNPRDYTSLGNFHYWQEHQHVEFPPEDVQGAEEFKTETFLQLPAAASPAVLPQGRERQYRRVAIVSLQRTHSVQAT